MELLTLQLTARTKLHIDIDHPGLKLHRHSPRRSVYRRNAGFVLITHRQVQDEIITSAQAKLAQS